MYSIDRIGTTICIVCHVGVPDAGSDFTFFERLLQFLTFVVVKDLRSTKTWVEKQQAKIHNHSPDSCTDHVLKEA